MLARIGSMVVGVAVTLLAPVIKSVACSSPETLPVRWAPAAASGRHPHASPRLAAHERAMVLSLLSAISYLGLGVPAVAAGILAVHGPGLIGAA
jgi:hypothetical protein